MSIDWIQQEMDLHVAAEAGDGCRTEVCIAVETHDFKTRVVGGEATVTWLASSY